MKKKQVQPPVATPNPALPFTEIQIGGKTYRMVFTYEALEAAELQLLERGIDVRLLACMVSRSLASTRTLFACSLVAFHPELDPRETRRWVTVQNLPEVLLAIDKAWNQSMPEAKAEEGEQGADPPQENGRS